MTETKDKPAIVVLSPSAMAVAEEIKSLTGGQIHGLSARVPNADITFDNAAQHVGSLFQSGQMIVGIMASGALIRLVAQHIENKHADPTVIAVADDGSCVVPLLGGHHGGNQIARVIADQLGGVAAITTAGDVRFGVALDEPPKGWVLINPQDAKGVMALLLAGATATIQGDLADEADWLSGGDLLLGAKGRVKLTATSQVTTPAENELVFMKRNLVVGVGCERGTAPEELIELVTNTLSDKQLVPQSVSVVTSLDVKSDELAVHALAEHLDCDVRFYDAATLEKETPRLENPSDVVFDEVGCHGVSEGAALAAVGKEGELVVPKQKSKRATVAVARSEGSFINTGRIRGHLSVVGIGPGSDGWRSPEVTNLISASTDLVGYSLYLDLLGNLNDGKTRHDFDLGKEEDRVRHAMELAGQGKDVALVWSGDAGIYAMATLVYELMADGGLSDGAQLLEQGHRWGTIFVRSHCRIC